MKVYTPVSGTVKAIEEVNDEVFALGMLGEGIAVIAEDSEILAPVNGVVSAVFPTNHAIGITSDDGVEVLIHIGIDTVNLQGKGFESFINVNDIVKVGDKLVSVDFDYVKKEGYEGDVIIVITNSKEYATIKATEVSAVKINDILLEIK